jgi:hypothetical protein
VKGLEMPIWRAFWGGWWFLPAFAWARVRAAVGGRDVACVRRFAGIRGLMRVLALASVCVTAPAHADLWGYVDDQGVVHTAREKLDDRYQLFVKGETSDAQAALRLSAELKNLPATDNLADHVIYRRVSKSPNVAKYDPLVLAAADKVALDPSLVKAVIAVESAYEPGAISPKGATGLMQLIPATAERYGVKAIADPKDNIGGGTRYLRDLLKMFDGNLPLALAGYNAGEGAVMRYKNTIPPFPETQNYVKLVMQFYAYFNPDAAARYGVGGTKNVRKDKDGRFFVTLPGRTGAPASGTAVGAASGKPTGADSRPVGRVTSKESIERFNKRSEEQAKETADKAAKAQQDARQPSAQAPASAQ